MIFYSGKVFSKEVFDKICKKKTLIFSSKTFFDENNLEIGEKRAVLENNAYDIVDFDFKIKVKALSSHKLDLFLNEEYKKYLGFILDINSVSFYFIGPSDLLPEMNLVSVDYCFIPVIGDCMNLFESIAATNVIDSKIFVPVGYGINEETSLIFCKRFTIKCPYESHLLRDESKIPNIDLLHD